MQALAEPSPSDEPRDKQSLFCRPRGLLAFFKTPADTKFVGSTMSEVSIKTAAADADRQ